MFVRHQCRKYHLVQVPTSKQLTEMSTCILAWLVCWQTDRQSDSWLVASFTGTMNLLASHIASLYQHVKFFLTETIIFPAVIAFRSFHSLLLLSAYAQLLFIWISLMFSLSVQTTMLGVSGSTKEVFKVGVTGWSNGWYINNSLDG